jgi:hypothetical protein
MGSGCSHQSFDVFNKDINEYTDSLRIWRYRMGDARCNDCQIRLRVIKKRCVEHNIPQLWEVFDIASCQHENLCVTNKERDPENERFTGRITCVACLMHVPGHATYKTKKVNGKYVDEMTSEWTVDNHQYMNELKEKKNKK